jgi:hypothetical protein
MYTAYRYHKECSYLSPCPAPDGHPDAVALQGIILYHNTPVLKYISYNIVSYCNVIVSHLVRLGVGRGQYYNII